MTPDPLDPLLARSGSAPSHLGRAELAALHQQVSTEPADEFILASTYAPGLSWDDGKERPPGFFEIHDRHWWVDATRPGGREYLTRLVAGTAIIEALRLSLSIRWVVQVFAAALTIESITVDDAGVRLAVHRYNEPILPAELTDEIHPDDFAEFVEAVTAAPPEIPLPAGGTIVFTNR